jgi:hypothetical protein
MATIFIAPRCQTQGGKTAGPYRHSEPMFTRLSNSSCGMPTTSRDMINVSKMGHRTVEGPAKLRVRRQKPPIRLALPGTNRAMDKATQGMANNWHFLGPHRGDLTSSSFVSESRLGGFLPTPPCGLASSRSGFPAREYPGKSRETPSQDLSAGGEGGISPCLILWRGTCPCWLSPMHSDLSSTQILTLALWCQISDR